MPTKTGAKTASSEIPKIESDRQAFAEQPPWKESIEWAKAGKRMSLPFSSAGGKDFPNFCH
jgi:hypothetical protein